MKESFKNKAGSVTITMSPKGNQIQVTRQLKLDNKLIQTARYSEFRELVNAWLEVIVIENWTIESTIGIGSILLEQLEFTFEPI